MQPDNAPESLDRAVSLEFIAQSGGYAVRLDRGQKKPHGEWSPKTTTKPKSDIIIEQLRADSSYNVGMHFHGRLIDIDVDSDASYLMGAIDKFLPHSSHVWGRGARVRTHRAYMLQSADAFDPADHPIIRRLKKIPEVKIEVRGGPASRGMYSVMPGSRHPDGDEYKWADIGAARSSPAVASLEQVLRGLRLAGAVAVLAPHWIEGQRNELSMALSGFLYRAYSVTSGVSDEAFMLDKVEALAFFEHMMDVLGDDPSDRVARVKTFERTWEKGEAGAPVTGATTIAEITDDKEIISKLYTLLSDSPDIPLLERYTERFVIWQGPGLAVDLDATASGSSRPFMTRQQFLNSWGHDFITYGDKKRLVADLMFHLKSTVRVAGITFEPGEPRLVDTREGKKVNQWCGFDIEPYDGKVTDKDVAPFLQYVEQVLAAGQPDRAMWIKGWIAHIFQEPANKCGTALVLVGVPGAGKSFLGHNIIMPIIGEMHSAVTNTVESITKDFNVAFDNKIFIQGDEATNNRQRAVAAKMRALITDPKKLVEPKGIDAFLKPNHTRFLFTSNDEEDAVHLHGGTDDRRYTILTVARSRKGDLEGYWHPLADWCADRGNLAKVHRWLLDYEYDRKFIGSPLVTDTKVEMQQRSWEPFDAWLASWLSREHPLHDAIHMKWYDAFIDKDIKLIDRTEWPEYVSPQALVRDYHYHVRSNNLRQADVLNERQIMTALQKRGLRPYDGSLQIKVKEWEDKKDSYVERRVRVYQSPPLEVVKTYMRDKFGFEIEDHDEEDQSQGS